MKIIFSHRCLEYSDNHIEGPGRVKEAYDILKNKGYEFIKPSPASYQDLLTVHSKEHVEKIKSGNFFDPDTPAYENIYEYARLSAGGAILATKEKGFSLMRPPGHHAGYNGEALGATTLGFCYFNNIAIAVKKLGLSTLILDIDGHHGNGTQEIFSGDPKVKFVSLHKRTYPGTGLVSEKNCINYVFSKSPGNKLYLKTLSDALKQIDMENVEMIGISAGFDCHYGDLASLDLTTESFKEIGKMIRDLERPVFGVLEGGYKGRVLGKDLHELIQGIEE